jgi:hypothetical protein
MSTLLPLLFAEAESPFVADPRPWLDDRLRLQIALDDTPFTFTPTWTNFTDITRGVAWEYRRDEYTGLCQPSTMQFVASNRDGRWDAATGLGGATWAGKVAPWLGVRVLCSTSDTFSPSTSLWRGFLSDIRLLSGPFDGHINAQCVDLLGVLASCTVEDLVRPEELPGPRVQAILTHLGIPSTFVDVIENGTVVMGAATIAGQGLALIQECARAEGGWAFCARDGRFEFRDRFHWIRTAQTGFEVDGSIIKHAELPQTLNRWNATQFAAVQGLNGTRRSGTLTTGFPAVARREMSVPAVWNIDADRLAERLRRASLYSGDRIESVDFDVMAHDVILEALEGDELIWQDTIDVTATPVHGHELNGEFWVESERHTVTRDGVWNLELALSPLNTNYWGQTANFYTFGATVTSGRIAGY